MKKFWKFTKIACISCCAIYATITIAITTYNPPPPQIVSSRLVVILGAGYLKSGDPVPALERRLQKGIEIWYLLQSNQISHQTQKNVYVMISGRKEEVQVMKNYLSSNGIADKYIEEDIEGNNTKSTVENAYHMSEKLQTEPIFISQAYHIPRIAFYTKFHTSKGAQFIATDRVNISLISFLAVSLRESFAIFLFPFIFLIEHLSA